MSAASLGAPEQATRERAVASPTPFVVFGDDWGRHVSTLQHVFARLVDRHPVVWVNSTNHRTPKLTLYDARRALEKARAMLHPPAPVAASAGPRPARLVAPKVLPWYSVRAVRALNRHSLVRDVRRALAEVAPGAPFVFVSATPTVPDVARALAPLCSVYFCMDDYGELPGVDRALVEPLEREYLAEADAVVATAQRLLEIKRPRSGRAFYLPQGVNYEHFATEREEPADLAAVPRPRIGFAGGVGPACDFALLRRLALTYRDASLVLVGPVSADLEALRLPNVYVLGNKRYDALPAYVRGFDVALIPYVLNDWTRAVDPLKLLEYLAAGAPVVTTPLPEVFKYAGAVTVAADDDAFVAGVGAALEGRAVPRERRLATARAHTWERRAETFLDVVRETCAAAGRGAFVPAEADALS